MKNTNNENCKYYAQHYCYNKTLKTFVNTSCGHCKKFKTNCKNCSSFTLQTDEVEKIEPSIHHQLSHALYILNNIVRLLENK